MVLLCFPMTSPDHRPPSLLCHRPSPHAPRPGESSVGAVIVEGRGGGALGALGAFGIGKLHGEALGYDTSRGTSRWCHQLIPWKKCHKVIANSILL